MRPITERIRKCTRCKHQWVIREAEPKKCPKCGSPYWNKKRTRPATVQAIRKGTL
jgi:hypothetical protein